MDNNIPDVCPSNGNYFGTACTPGAAMFNEDIGVRIEGPQADFNRLEGNVVSGSGRDGISVLNTFNQANPPDANIPQNTDTLIKGNNSSANGTAVTVLDAQYGPLGGRCFTTSVVKGCPTRTTVIDTVFNDNPAHGLNLDKSQGNKVEHNEAHGNGFQTKSGSDPPFTDAFDTNPGCDDNIWLHNEFGTVNQPCVRGNDPSGSMSAGATAEAQAYGALGMPPANATCPTQIGRFLCSAGE